MKSSYKILHTTCHTGWGGLEKRIFNESVWMEENGHKIIIAAPKETPLYERAKARGFKVYPVDFRRLTIGRDYSQLKRILYNEKPWVINTHGNRDSKLGLYAAQKADVPLRILSRHISAHVRKSWYNTILYKKWCHYVFTTADYTTRHLRKVFKLKDMQVFSMPSGIVLPKSLPDRTDAKNRLIEKLTLSPETRFIGFIGRVSRDKGVATLLKGFGRIKDRLPGYHLVIVGDGVPKYLESLKRLATKLNITDRVHFEGFTDHVWTYYRALDCKVLPSRNIRGVPFEGVPQSLLEAMICECPVIGSDSGGIRDIIVHNETGLLFEPDSHTDLADKLLITLKDKNATTDRVGRARERVEQHHTIDAMGRNIVRIYRLHQVRLEREAAYVPSLS
jgi:glycosyltransferase involved in cell wall biosynthesis